MRLSTDEDGTRGLGAETTPRLRAGFTVFDTAHVHTASGRTISATTSGSWHGRFARAARRKRADRDEGRDAAGRRRLIPDGARRRSAPTARRASSRSTGPDRPLPRPRARPEYAVADDPAGARAARRRGPRPTRRRRERQPPAARRGARARAGRGRPGRAEPRRRPGASRRARRAVRRRRRRGDRPLAAGRGAPGGLARAEPRRSPRSRGAVGHAGRGRARVAAAQSPAVVAIPGARQPETAVSASRAATLELAREDLDALGRSRPRARATPTRDGDVVPRDGHPGAGRRRRRRLRGRGYRRLNRDERAGSLRELAEALDEELAAGERRIVLDNTYVTRSARSYVVDAARRHGVLVRCVWLDTPLARAGERRRAAARPLRRPADARRAAGGVTRAGHPFRRPRRCACSRELEPPSDDEGFAGPSKVGVPRVPKQGGRACSSPRRWKRRARRARSRRAASRRAATGPARRRR